MEGASKTHIDNHTSFHFERSRLNQLFAEAVKYPLVVVCAGAGYGKTSAVHDFTQEYKATTAWGYLSERDNSSARFWEGYIHTMSKINEPFARELTKMSFPDTKEKIKSYQTLLSELVEKKRRIIVMDDFHCIEEPSVIRFVEECILFKNPPGTSVFMLTRSTPRVNIAGLVYRDKIFNISEDDLRFTESELSQYFHKLNLSPSQEDLRGIMQDTKGWAFAINLIARSYQKAPGYGGYARNAMKTNIFRLMETEIWDGITECLQNFLIRLSLIDHLSIDLINQLAGGDAGLITEFERLNAYVRRDDDINAYFIHPLFLEFLKPKQESIQKEQKLETYAIAGDWCAKNGFKIDAMSYYEKTGNYPAIVSILDELTALMPQNIAQYAAPIFDRAPPDVFDKVESFAEMHLRTYMCQGLWQKTLELLKYYEAKFLQMTEDNIVRRHNLASLYILWSYIRGLMSVTDNVFDAPIYIEKADKCFSAAIFPRKFGPYSPCAWVNCAGSARKGIPEEWIASMGSVKNLIKHDFTKDIMGGIPELARGELDFYRGNSDSAKPNVALAIKLGRANKQFGLINKALYYTLRIAAAQGNFPMMEQSIKETKDQLDEAEYFYRYIDYDIALSWYYCFLGLPEKMADWLKEDFSPYIHAGFIENFGNQIKARFCYATRNYSPLLAYIEEMKTRESFLFGRIEMLAMEACVHYKMKNKEKAFAVFEEAYNTASPNEIVMPFVELGKDMRTLASAMLKESKKIIPAAWLEDINHKSATYAKRRSHIIAKHLQASGVTDSIVLSAREAEILTDISHGLSRSEIAVTRKLSTNTVKMVINKIRFKLGAENMADIIRIAVERKLIT